jgi:hypothetical protein
MSSTQLKEEIAAIRAQIGDHYTSITELEKALVKTERQLYRSCQHHWAIDRVSCNEHTEYICGDCGMSRNINL